MLQNVTLIHPSSGRLNQHPHHRLYKPHKNLDKMVNEYLTTAPSLPPPSDQQQQTTENNAIVVMDTVPDDAFDSGYNSDSPVDNHKRLNIDFDEDENISEPGPAEPSPPTKPAATEPTALTPAALRNKSDSEHMQKLPVYFGQSALQISPQSAPHLAHHIIGSTPHQVVQQAPHMFPQPAPHTPPQSAHRTSPTPRTFPYQSSMFDLEFSLKRQPLENIPVTATWTSNPQIVRAPSPPPLLIPPPRTNTISTLQGHFTKTIVDKFQKNFYLYQQQQHQQQQQHHQHQRSPVDFMWNRHQHTLDILQSARRQKAIAAAGAAGTAAAGTAPPPLLKIPEYLPQKTYHQYNRFNSPSSNHLHLHRYEFDSNTSRHLKGVWFNQQREQFYYQYQKRYQIAHIPLIRPVPAVSTHSAPVSNQSASVLRSQPGQLSPCNQPVPHNQHASLNQPVPHNQLASCNQPGRCIQPASCNQPVGHCIQPASCNQPVGCCIQPASWSPSEPGVYHRRDINRSAAPMFSSNESIDMMSPPAAAAAVGGRDLIIPTSTNNNGHTRMLPGNEPSHVLPGNRSVQQMISVRRVCSDYERESPAIPMNLVKPYEPKYFQNLPKEHVDNLSKEHDLKEDDANKENIETTNDEKTTTDDDDEINVIDLMEKCIIGLLERGVIDLSAETTSLSRLFRDKLDGVDTMCTCQKCGNRPLRGYRPPRDAAKNNPVAQMCYAKGYGERPAKRRNNAKFKHGTTVTAATERFNKPFGLFSFRSSSSADGFIQQPVDMTITDDVIDSCLNSCKSGDVELSFDIAAVTTTMTAQPTDFDIDIDDLRSRINEQSKLFGLSNLPETTTEINDLRQNASANSTDTVTESTNERLSPKRCLDDETIEQNIPVKRNRSFSR